MIKENPNISTSMMAGKLGISKRAVIKYTNQLQLDGKIRRNGSPRCGFWEIVNRLSVYKSAKKVRDIN